ncbi:hypothetical protein ES703_115952 [subsurface metagenome]
MKEKWIKRIQVDKVVDTTGCGDSFAGGLAFVVVPPRGDPAAPFDSGCLLYVPRALLRNSRHTRQRLIRRTNRGEIALILLANVRTASDTHHQLKTVRQTVTGKQLSAGPEKFGNLVRSVIRHSWIQGQDDELAAFQPLCRNVQVAEHNVREARAVKKLGHNVGVLFDALDFTGRPAGGRVTANDDNLSARAK